MIKPEQMEYSLIDTVTDAALESLCIPRKLLGYGYLFLAIRCILSHPSDVHPSMLKEVYPYVASHTGTNLAMAERAMRYAIERGWKRAPQTVRASYLGLENADVSIPPTNVEFVYLVAERVRLIVGDPEGEARFLGMLACSLQSFERRRGETVDGGLPLC